MSKKEFEFRLDVGDFSSDEDAINALKNVLKLTSDQKFLEKLDNDLEDEEVSINKRNVKLTISRIINTDLPFWFMSKIPEILNNAKQGKKNGELYITLDDFPAVPTTDKNIDYLFIMMSLQSMILKEEGIEFPSFVERWCVDITPDGDNLKNNRFSLEGIRDLVIIFKRDILKGKTFIKTQLIYEDGEQLPTIRIHFFRFIEEGEYIARHESFLYPFIFFLYEENFFSEERIKAMEDNGIDFGFMEVLPVMNICRVEFDENGHLKPLKELEKYSENWE